MAKNNKGNRILMVDEAWALAWVAEDRGFNSHFLELAARKAMQEEKRLKDFVKDAANHLEDFC